jgi:outer membrane protein assembly factor BamD (BamD/ComL family)
MAPLEAAREVAPAAPAQKPAARSVAAAASASDDGDLSEQLRLIDAARSAVAAGNASAASAAIANYGKRFPRGAFGQEAAVLRIQTLELQGNHSQAAAQARSFLARHPNSPHVSVVRRIAE